MKNDSTRTLTPKLRFPEFRNDPEWTEVPLEQIADRATTKNHDGSIARVLTNSAEHGVVDQRDYFDKDIAKAGNTGGYYIVDLDDFVYNPRTSSLAPVGPISKNDLGKGVMSPLYTVFRFKDENTDFYQCYFKSASWHSYLRRVSSMGARHDRMNISSGDFMAMPVPRPQAKEQQKISDCLNSLDELITVEDRKLKALRNHKRGLMQQLFPQPGQSQPRLRFPEFRDKGEWERLPFARVIKIASGQVDPTKSPYCNWAHIGGENIQSHTGIIENIKTAKELQLISGKYVFDEKDVLYSKIRPALNKIATPNFKGLCSADIYPIRPSSRKLRRDFLGYLLLSDTFLEHAIMHSDRGKIPKINRETLLAFKSSLPSPSEQKKIVNVFKAIDSQITTQTENIKTLKQHKRGLLQQLFPTPEESEA